KPRNHCDRRTARQTMAPEYAAPSPPSLLAHKAPQPLVQHRKVSPASILKPSLNRSTAIDTSTAHGLTGPLFDALDLIQRFLLGGPFVSTRPAQDIAAVFANGQRVAAPCAAVR